MFEKHLVLCSCETLKKANAVLDIKTQHLRCLAAIFEYCSQEIVNSLGEPAAQLPPDISSAHTAYRVQKPEHGALQ